MSAIDTEDILAEIAALVKIVEKVAERVDEIVRMLEVQRES